MMSQFSQIIILLVGLTTFVPAFSQDYYSEYGGDHRTAFYSVHVGRNSAVGAFKTNSYAQNGLTFGFHRGSAPFINAYKFLKGTKLRMAYEYGTSVSLQRMGVRQLRQSFDVSLSDTTQYLHISSGGSLRLIHPIGKQFVLEFRAGLYPTIFVTPNLYSFYYNTDNGREEIITTFEKRIQLQLSKQIGLTLRYWNLGLNVEYNWYQYNTETTILASNSDISSTFDFNGIVQTVKITIAYYFPR